MYIENVYISWGSNEIFEVFNAWGSLYNDFSVYIFVNVTIYKLLFHSSDV